MLDKTSKKFLDFLDRQTDDSISLLDDFEYPDEFGPDNVFWSMIRFLEKSEYIELIKTSSGITIGVQLSHKGIRRKEFRKHEIVEYIREKWIDFLAFVVSFFALAISMYSLSLQLTR